MQNDKQLFDPLMTKLYWPSPSENLYSKIMAQASAMPMHLKLKIAALFGAVIVSVFLSGFMHFIPQNGASSYYAGSGSEIVKYLGS